MAKKNGKEDLLDYGLNQAKLTEFSVEEFFDESLRLYSAHSNVRGIPFIGDGFKEAQRKAMWGMLDRGESAPLISVERVSATCAAATDYHHGIGSMQGTIVGLAQDFAGSNNINFLVPDGQFGIRGAHASSAARYIQTTLHDNFRKIFRKEDDILFDRKRVGDLKIEPKFFIPMLPVVLLNGAEGMGTGHATHIFCYKPEDLKSCIQDVLAGKELKPNRLTPWWNGFIGSVERDKESGQVVVKGDFTIENSTKIRITELPVGVQTENYEDHLWKLVDRGVIKRFKDESDKNGFDIIIEAPRTTTMRPKDELMKLFKLESRDSENFTVWGPNGSIKKYETAEELLVDWVIWRLDQFEKRRLEHIKLTQETIRFTEESIRFINFYLANVEKFRGCKKEEMIAALIDEKFVDYNDLLSMPIWNLTKEKIDALGEKLKKEQTKLADLEADNATSMFNRELKDVKL